LSPILVRPVREQLEHDRVIRLLQAKYRRRFNVGLNPGGELTAPAGDPAAPLYPDLVLTAPGRGKRTLGIIEVETSESVNNLEAMAQWVPYSRLSAPFILYVPVGSVDPARRLCRDLGVAIAEIWTYHTLGDQLRFIQVYHTPDARATARASRPVQIKPKPKAAAPKKAFSKPRPAKPSSASRATARPVRATKKTVSHKKK
jgi:hypothetical protein